MSIIRCTDCGRFYFDKKDYCPKCGCPTSVSLGARAKGRTKHNIAVEKLDEKVEFIKTLFKRKKHY